MGRKKPGRAGNVHGTDPERALPLKRRARAAWVTRARGGAWTSLLPLFSMTGAAARTCGLWAERDDEALHV